MESWNHHSRILGILWNHEIMYHFRYCGTELRCLATAPATTTANAAGQTVCTMNKPFKIGVHSDNYEYADATGTAPEGTLDNNRGFSISKLLMISKLLYSRSKYITLL